MTNNIYLITGATSDIGIALIKTIARKGDKFLLQGHSDFSALKQLCDDYSISADFFDVNLADTCDTDKFIEKISSFSPTHFIHLPALRVVNTKFKNFDEQRFLTDINIQIMSAVKICKVIAPKMAKCKFGRILFMATSYVLANPPKNTAAYIMAKNAVVGLAKSLAADYAPYGVTVNCISPSMIETKFLSETSHIIIEQAAAAHPMKRNATVDDIVPAMEFLLSEKAAYITGVNLPITGGSIIE